MRHTGGVGGQVRGMDELSGDPAREHRFRRLYVDVYADVLRFVQRRVADGAGGGVGGTAEDVTAEVFLVVWRRVDDVPGGDGGNSVDAARAWVFGIARNLLLNSRRGARRQVALGVRLADAERVQALGSGAVGSAAVASKAADHGASEVALRVDLERAWRELSDVHQEALALSAFEGLDSHEAAAVLGITATAFRLRLSRARKTLRSALGAEHARTPLSERL